MSDPHVDRIRAQFTRQAETYAEMQQHDEAGLRLLVALAGARASDRALDVACGPGFLTLAFAKACAQARGVDATPAFVERARRVAAERGIANVSFVQGDVNALPEDDASYDVVACRAAFHHFPDPARVCVGSHRRALPQAELQRLFRAQGLELVREPTSELHYDVEEWIAHGGPDAATAAQIRALLESSMEGDRAGLAVYRRDGRLRFRHRTAAFTLRKP